MSERKKTYLLPGKLETAHSFGKEVARKLEGGDTEPLPDDFYRFLDLQTGGIGSPAVDEARDGFRERFQDAPEPYSAEFAKQLGATLTRFIDATNQAAVLGAFNEIEVGLIWDRP